MGRTGTLWRCDAEEIVPDIMTFGKAFGGGVMPITGLICRPAMWSEELIENPYLLGSTTVIKDVRGVGLMMAVEFVSDECGYEFSKEMYNQHVIISGTLNNSQTIRFELPASLTPDEIAKILDASDKAAAKAKEVFGL